MFCTFVVVATGVSVNVALVNIQCGVVVVQYYTCGTLDASKLFWSILLPLALHRSVVLNVRAFLLACAMT